MDGDKAIVGSLYESSLAYNAGAAYLFVRDTGGWSQGPQLQAPNGDYGDAFSSAVGLRGDTAFIGAQSEDGKGAGAGGEPNDELLNKGAAYAFSGLDGEGWAQMAYLEASNVMQGDHFGTSIAVDDETLVVGAPMEDGSSTGVDGDLTDDEAERAGAAYVFSSQAGEAWSETAYLKASNTDPGDRLGTSVAVAGDIVAVGASAEDSVATGVGGDQADDSADAAGAEYVYTR